LKKSYGNNKFCEKSQFAALCSKSENPLFWKKSGGPFAFWTFLKCPFSVFWLQTFPKFLPFLIVALILKHTQNYVKRNKPELKYANIYMVKRHSRFNISIFYGIIVFIGIFIITYIYNTYTRSVEPFETNNLPRTIWIFWDSEELPDDINAIITNNKKILTEDWTINLVNTVNLNTYLSLDTFPKNYSSLSVQHKSDYIRLRLLQKYGGVWLDAGIIINSKSEFDNLFNVAKNSHADLLAFTLGEKDAYHKYHPFIENWFLIAPKNSKLINLWLAEFEKAITMGFDDYHNSIKDSTYICEKIKGFGTYLTMHKCLQVVLQTQCQTWEPTLILQRAEDTMFKLNGDCDWKEECIKNKFDNEADAVRQIPYMKFTGSQRKNGINFDKYFLA